MERDQGDADPMHKHSLVFSSPRKGCGMVSMGVLMYSVELLLLMASMAFIIMSLQLNQQEVCECVNSEGEVFPDQCLSGLPSRSPEENEAYLKNQKAGYIVSAMYLCEILLIWVPILLSALYGVTVSRFSMVDTVLRFRCYDIVDFLTLFTRGIITTSGSVVYLIIMEFPQAEEFVCPVIDPGERIRVEIGDEYWTYLLSTIGLAGAVCFFDVLYIYCRIYFLQKHLSISQIFYELILGSEYEEYQAINHAHVPVDDSDSDSIDTNLP